MSRKNRIAHILNQELHPSFLSVENESGNHHVPEGSETHFKVIAVSTRFSGLTRIARHRLLNNFLAEELQQGLHALSMHLYTAEEWEKNQGVLKSPACRDGFGS